MFHSQTRLRAAANHRNREVPQSEAMLSANPKELVCYFKAEFVTSSRATKHTEKIFKEEESSKSQTRRDSYSSSTCFDMFFEF